MSRYFIFEKKKQKLDKKIKINNFFGKFSNFQISNKINIFLDGILNKY